MKQVKNKRQALWFDYKIKLRNHDLSSHEKAYQLSLNKTIGGSENISYLNENT